MGNVFSAQERINSIVNSPIWPKFEFVLDFMPILVICKFDEDRIKSEGVTVDTSFSPL